MKSSVDSNRYILLPALGLQADFQSNPKVQDFLLSLDDDLKAKKSSRLNLRVRGPKRETMNLKVVDSIHENGAKLVEMDEAKMADLKFSYPGIRIIPERFYRKALIRPEVRIKAKRVRETPSMQVKITNARNEPLQGVYVVAFTNFEEERGASGYTNSKGVVSLKLDTPTIERLYVYPDHSYWGFFRKNIRRSDALNITLQDINLTSNDIISSIYNQAQFENLRTPVRIGVIDTGIGPHRDITVLGGANFIPGEDDADHKDNGDGHGTHVAGIIGADGQIKGLAAGAELYSYRVFPKGGDASNFHIMKAIDRARMHQCDIINLSLGSEEMDEAIISSIRDAYSEGILCFAANGNDGRAPVNFPAAYSLTIAVSAMGQKGTFPRGTVQTSMVKSPFGTDKKNFIAGFSNVGPETDLIAPGVGVISTYPNDLYAVMDGTSMACPAAVGMAARLLSTRADILQMPRNQQRADEMLKFLSVKTSIMGFGANFEGKGMLFS